MRAGPFFVGRVDCEKCHGSGLAITDGGWERKAERFVATFTAARCDCVKITTADPFAAPKQICTRCRLYFAGECIPCRDGINPPPSSLP